MILIVILIFLSYSRGELNYSNPTVRWDGVIAAAAATAVLKTDRSDFRGVGELLHDFDCIKKSISVTFRFSGLPQLPCLLGKKSCHWKVKTVVFFKVA